MKVYFPLLTLDELGGVAKAKEKVSQLTNIPENEIEIFWF